MSGLNDKFSQRIERSMVALPSTGGFWANIKIIRPVAWVIAVLLMIGMDALLYFVAFREAARGHSPMPLALKIFLSAFGPLVLAAMALLIGYVYADAKRRGMRYVMWTLLAILIPDLIGVILYFLLREPMPTPCPKCGFLAHQRFAFCPQCSTPLNRICAVCRRNLEYGWSACAYCGTPVAGPVAAPAATAKP